MRRLAFAAVSAVAVLAGSILTTILTACKEVTGAIRAFAAFRVTKNAWQRHPAPNHIVGSIRASPLHASGEATDGPAEPSMPFIGRKIPPHIGNALAARADYRQSIPIGTLPDHDLKAIHSAHNTTHPKALSQVREAFAARLAARRQRAAHVVVR